MAESSSPKSWNEALYGLIASLTWILPLVGAERLWEEHYYQAGLALIAWLAASAFAIHSHVFAGGHGRQRVAWIAIGLGAVFLCSGIYLLAKQLPPDARADSVGGTPALVTASNKETEYPSLGVVADKLYGRGPALKRKLTRKEAETMIDELGELRALVKSGLGISQPLGIPPTIAGRSTIRWAEPIWKNGIDETLNNFADFRIKVADFKTRLNAKISERPDYSDDFRTILGKTNFDELDLAIHRYMGKLNTLKADQVTAQQQSTIEAVMEGVAVTLRDECQNFRTWISMFENTRAPYTRKEIDSFL